MSQSRRQQGLYSPAFEHDNCGIGAVVNIKGEKSHQIVADALRIVEHLEHRAGKDAEGRTGDGVGILTQISHRFPHILSQAGLAPFRFHDLRHYSASIQHALGVKDAYIMERGGWNNDKVLKEVYRHTLSEESQKANEISNGHFEKLYNTKCNTKK